MNTRKIPLSFMVIFCFFLLALMLPAIMTNCSATKDDDDVDQSTPTATATSTPEGGDTPTPTNTPEFSPTQTPTPEESTGILCIWTAPILGDIYLDLQWVGYGLFFKEMDVGEYHASFGYQAGYETPPEQQLWVVEDQITFCEGYYSEQQDPCLFENVMVDGEPYMGETVYLFMQQELMVEFEFLNGDHWDASAMNGWIDITTGGPGYNIITYLAMEYGDDTLALEGTGFGSGNDCIQIITIYVEDPA
jgi:hypothetical protein